MPDREVIAIIEMYKQRLRGAGIPKIRIDLSRTFGSLSKEEALAHAHYLCNGVKKFAKNSKKPRKTGRHLAAVQMLLSFADWYTLEDLMHHNRLISD